MKRALLLVALVGCDRWETCEERADWHLDFTLTDVSQGFEGEFSSGAQQAAGVLTRARDGTLLLFMNDSGGEVQFGPLRVSGTAIARIGSDGQLLGLAPAPDIPNGSTSITTDAAGNVVIAQFAGMLQLYSYDASLHRRWTTVLPGNGIPPNVAAGGDGLVAIASRGSGSGDTLALYNPDGSQRWSLPLNAGLANGVWLDDTGDVHAYTSIGSGFLHIHYSPDGMFVGSNSIERTPTAFGTDGSYVVAGLADQFNSTGPLQVARYTVDGTRLWRREIDSNGFVNVAVADNGDVIIPTTNTSSTSLTARVLRFDAKSGDTRDDAITCSQMMVVGGDSGHYFGIGQVGAIPAVGIAGFSF